MMPLDATGWINSRDLRIMRTGSRINIRNVQGLPGEQVKAKPRQSELPRSLFLLGTPQMTENLQDKEDSEFQMTIWSYQACNVLFVPVYMDQ
jgi:hypothetical protein